MFVKHYAPTFASLNMAKCAQCPHKTFWTLLKSLTGNLLIIPYQLTKFQTPSLNLTRLKCPLQRAITQENSDRIFSKVPLIISALNRSSSHRCGFESRSGHVRQAKFCLQVVRWFFFRISRFRPTYGLTRHKMCEIIVMGCKIQFIYKKKNSKGHKSRNI